MLSIPQLSLHDGGSIPQVGFGVFQIPEDETFAAVTSALAAGYRHLDTAKIYGNEKAVGRAMAESGLPREDIFLTTKCWNEDQGHDSALAAVDASLERLGTDYLDLYLIHWPMPKRDLYVDTWRAFEKIHADGKARHIGVSNFLVPHLQRLMDETDTVPVINQIELHPWLQQEELRAFHAEHDIRTEAWSPIAQGGDYLESPTLVEVAERHDVTPAQVILRWHLDLGNVIIPKSVNPDRMAANLDLFDLQLDDEDSARIAKLDEGTRTGPDPDELNE
ncbi:MAG: aldo/keto reductase [Nocardioidaceae bacterium]